jgi:hypothetical protein
MKLYSLLIFLVFAATVSRADTIDSLLAPLKAELRLKARYDSQKEATIEKHKTELERCRPGDLDRRYRLCMALYREYKVYKFDSAFVYVQKLLKLAEISGDNYKKHESQISMGVVLESTGLYLETNELMVKIIPEVLEKPLRLQYFELLFHFENDLANYNQGTFNEMSHRLKASHYLDSAITYTLPGSFERHIHLGEKADPGNSKAGTAHYWYLYKNYPLTIHQRAMVATGLSYDYSGNEKIALLVTGAINDIRASIKETEAIFLLGKELAAAGRLDDAFAFVQAAMDDAEFFNARLRKVNISSKLSIISANRVVQVENEKATFIIYMITIIAIAIIIFLIAFIVFFQMRRLKSKEVIIKQKNAILERTNERLYSDSRIKEEYIGYFFKVFSGYIKKMEKLKLRLERTLRTGKYEEALAMTHGIDIKKEREELFNTFDQTFLRLFPNFIGEFNLLLREEDRLQLKDNELLSTHMRIFALMRLGIVNNKVVADILEYSESTIYTYKNRIKNKAMVPGIDFDDAIMNIKIGL